jgi:hypothetical protein
MVRNPGVEQALVPAPRSCTREDGQEPAFEGLLSHGDDRRYAASPRKLRHGDSVGLGT